MTARVGVVTFPGSLDDRDALRAVAAGGSEAVALWHADTDLTGVDAVVLPGGFSYGDYLRCGAIAALSPMVQSIKAAAATGLPVLGICNGFQILMESHMLPGALMRNDKLHFICRDQTLEIANAGSDWTRDYTAGQEIRIPIKNIDGRYVADEETLDDLEANARVIAYYTGGNPNGSARDIAGITNEAGNVVGIMPHPEHAIDPLTGTSADGLGFFTSILQRLVNA